MIARFSQHGRMLSRRWPIDTSEVYCCQCSDRDGLRLVGDVFLCQAHDPARGRR